jgi:hypothetical protein
MRPQPGHRGRRVRRHLPRRYRDPALLSSDITQQGHHGWAGSPLVGLALIESGLWTGFLGALLAICLRQSSSVRFSEAQTTLIPGHSFRIREEPCGRSARNVSADPRTWRIPRVRAMPDAAWRTTRVMGASSSAGGDDPMPAAPSRTGSTDRSLITRRSRTLRRPGPYPAGQHRAARRQRQRASHRYDDRRPGCTSYRSGSDRRRGSLIDYDRSWERHGVPSPGRVCRGRRGVKDNWALVRIL